MWHENVPQCVHSPAGGAGTWASQGLVNEGPSSLGMGVCCVPASWSREVVGSHGHHGGFLTRAGSWDTGETQRAGGKPGGDGGAAPCLQPLGLLIRTGSGEGALLLVLAPAGTAGAALLYHVLAALVEDGLALGTPDCGVKLKGEDDVVVVADLADEAALGAQVAVVDVLGGELDQRLEEPFIPALCDLLEVSDTELVRRL